MVEAAVLVVKAAVLVAAGLVALLVATLVAAGLSVVVVVVDDPPAILGLSIVRTFLASPLLVSQELHPT